ncbi:replication initiation negative regulator SeqA [Endozoicomonas sp. G2_1]|uniref:replication initiation negative regulator SeqA n=1 Tax=Endozoicomonas sp. G2_1 TaxID=2821091 RepID=UPI001ADB3480|nr:replication initiation negative regulator SeqA [Endozoicomonas sp. G2_1]MBO9491949.1 replication initiation negative regulator SeqA [Endozoicomonas sp. G2_1]
MKTIEVDDALYQYIASNTQFIGESASSILRRLLAFEQSEQVANDTVTVNVSEKASEPDADQQPPAQAKPSSAPNKAKKVGKTTSSEKAVKSVKTSNKKAVKSVKTSNKKASTDSVFDYINKEELAIQRGAVGRFLIILAALYRVHQQEFGLVTDIRGRDRLYFARSESELAESGSSTKPRQIPDSPFWVITNSNTTRKKMMLTEVANSLGYNEADAEKIRELL